MKGAELQRMEERMSTLKIETMSGSDYTIVQDDNGDCFLCGGKMPALTQVSFCGKLEVGLPLLATWGQNAIIRTSPVKSITAL